MHPLGSTLFLDGSVLPFHGLICRYTVSTVTCTILIKHNIIIPVLYLLTICMNFAFIKGSSGKTGRGKGTCPRCNGFYVNRYKPENCQNCGFELGGNYVPKKKPRLEVPKSTLVLQSGQLSIYSVNTSTHDDRCIVIVNANASIREHRQCKQSRASLVNSMKSANFSCEHLRSTETCITSPSAVF